MSAPAFPFDAVLFDLDGTLVATDGFWPQAARKGALRAFAELGLEREPPASEEWMSMVGLSIDLGFGTVFADLGEDARAHVMRRCLEEEQRALDEGGAALLPGVEDVLDELRARGVKMGIASNCSRAYLDAMLDGVGLARWVGEPRCLDSPGIRNKADMVEDLVSTFDTRSVVMVGDRLGDRDAAWANGLPHVHLARGYGSHEEVRCEAVIDGFDQLLPRLERRTTWLRSAIAALELPAGYCTLGVSGPLGAGKSLFARDLGRLLEAEGRVVRRIEADHASGIGEMRELPALQARGADVAIVVGATLGRGTAAESLDRLVALAAPREVLERRIVGHHGRRSGSVVVERALEALDRQLALEPGRRPDVELDAANALGPPA